MTTEKTGVDLDLDALAPTQVNINYKSKVIQVNPLDLVQFSKLYNLATDMGKIKEFDDNPDKVVEIYGRVETLIKEAIPELADEKLNNLQLTAIFNLLAKINTPQDKAIKELEKRGINLSKDEGGKSDPKVLTS